MNHTANVHHWSGKQLFHSCEHEDLGSEEEKTTTTKWMEMGSPAHKALGKVVYERQLLKDMAQMTKYKHTGGHILFCFV